MYGEASYQVLVPYVEPAVSLGVWGSAAAAAYAISFWQPDNTPAPLQTKDDKKITIQPPPVVSNNQPSVPVVKQKNKIDLPPALDLTKYRSQDLKPDRSFIRAFYFIRNKEDPTDEQLNTFVETDIITCFLDYPLEKMNRIFYVMHFAGKYETAPYINFCKIREAGLKSLDKNSKVTIKDLLNAADASDTLIRKLETTIDNIGTFSKVITEKILPRNSSFFTDTATKQQDLIKQHAPNNSKVLELFKRLSALTGDKTKLYEILEDCLKDECKNLTVKGSTHMKNDVRYRNFIKTLSNSETKGEVDFPFRCGIGDMLANTKTKGNVCVTHIKEEEKDKKAHLNYACDDRNSLDPNRYIIYEYKDHHCVLLTPNSIVSAPNKVNPTEEPIASQKLSSSSPTSGAPKTKAASTIQNPCVEHDKLFLRGGTRKHRKRKQKRKTKSRKSRRKGTRRI